MKKIIARYWGIALVLAVLAGLLVPVAPVSAGDTAWSSVATPNTTNAKLTAGTNVSLLGMAADGKTMFVYDNNTNTLYKSADSGATWTNLTSTTYGLGTALTAFAVSAGYATDNTLVAANAGQVYMSTNGGTTWFTPITLPAGAAPVASVAVGPDYQGGTKVLIGTSTGTSGGAMYSWRSQNFTLTTEPVVNSGSGTGATATATMGVATIAFTAGTGFAVGDTLTIVPPAGGTAGIATVTALAAAATATATMGLDVATVTGGGTGYAVGDVLTLSQAGATAGTVTVSTIGAGGVITAVTTTTRGTGYTGTAVVVSGGTPSAVATMTVALRVVSIAVVTGGGGYAAAPAVTVAAAPAGGTTATATATAAGGLVTSIAVTGAGAGYTSVPAVTMPASGAPSTATVTAGSGYTTSAVTLTTLTGTGTGAAGTVTLKVVSYAVTAAGAGYAVAPTVTVDAAPAGGTNATATATIGAGAVTAVNIVVAGSGYTSVPAVAIASGAGLGGDVVAVALSPNFLADGEMLALVANSTVTQLHAKIAQNAWDANSKQSTVTGVLAAVGMKAVLDFGADYSFSDNAYVLIGLSGSASDDLWRARLGTSASTAVDLGIGGVGTATAVSSIDIKGNMSDGTAYIGLAASAGVDTATALTGTATFTTTNSKAPSGASNTMVKVAATGIVAGTSGTGSAFCLSTDNAATFNQISLISFSALNTLMLSDLKIVDANTMFLVAKDGGAGVTYGVVFMTKDGGATWNGVFNNSSSPIFGVFPSPKYATDSTVYVALNNLTVRKSVNGGSSYSTALVGGTADMTAFYAVDGTNFFVGSQTGLLYKSGRFVTFGQITGANVTSIAVASNGNVVVGTSAGDALVSTDDGITFTSLALGGTSAVTSIVLDTNYATNSVTYGTTVANGLLRDNPTNGIVLDPAPVAGAYAVISNDGNVYYGGATIRRALNPAIGGTASAAAQGWDTLSNANFAGWPATASVVKLGIVNTLLSGTAYVHDVYALVTGATTSVTYPFSGRVYVASDRLTNPMTITAPANNANVSTTQQVMWAAYPGIPAGIATNYDIQFASDALFTLGTQTINTGSAATVALLPAIYSIPGNTYYVRVRVSAATPLLSNWSAGVKYSVKLVQSGNDITGGINSAISPAPGATGVAVKPTFSWAAVDRAVSYNLQVADNPVFVNPLDNQTGLNTNVWLETKTLDPGKTYYWRVQAVTADGILSDWFQFDFTTAVPAPTAPTPTVTTTAPALPPITLPAVTVTQTPPPSPKFFDPQSGLYFNTQAELTQYQAQHATPATPATPAYIWVIIVIGAVLIIAVIVLIARTRRV